MRVLNELFLLRTIYHIYSKLFEDNVQHDDGYDNEPELIPSGEQAAFGFSWFRHVF